MSDKNTTSPKGISFTEGLTLLFIGLKLAGIIGWSWLWVLSPIVLSWLIAAVVVSLAYWQIKRND